MAVGMIPVRILLLMKVMYLVVDSASMNHFCDSVLAEVRKCGLQELVLLTSEGSFSRRNIENEMMDSVSGSGIPFFHYVISKYTTIDDVTDIIRRHSVNQHFVHTTFLITTPRFNDVIVSAGQYSENGSHYKSIVWLHTTRWLIISKSYSDTKRAFKIHEHAPMDNIAIVSINTASDPYTENVTEYNTTTLMWAAGRTRKPSEIIHNKLSNECVIFPNIAYGFNRRHLTVITKVHWEFFVYIGSNHETGKPEYKGFLIDVLHTLASALNFTYTITPDPAKALQASWDEVAHNVTQGLVDMSATTWSYSWVDVYNISVTYPVIVDTFTGVYRRQQPSEEYTSLYIICPFHSFTYVLLFASLVYTLIVYVVIVGLVYPNENCLKPRNPLTANRRNIFASAQIHGNRNALQNRLLVRNIIERLRKIAWAFAASVLNQAYLPRPKQMSARLLLFLWSLAMVMFYAIFTGSLTAEMVNSSNADPINSFQELVSRSDYRWGTTDDSIIDKVMKKASHGILHRLNQGIVNIPDGVDGDIYYTLKHKIETLKDDFVFIHFKSLLNQIVGVMNNPEQYVFIKDSLLSANQGFIVSNDSELGPVFSKSIREMHDAGLINKLYDKYAHGNRTVNVECNKGGRTRKALTLHNIQWPLIIIAILVLISLAVLIVERLWLPVLALRQSGDNKK